MDESFCISRECPTYLTSSILLIGIRIQILPLIRYIYLDVPPLLNTSSIVLQWRHQLSFVANKLFLSIVNLLRCLIPQGLSKAMKRLKKFLKHNRLPKSRITRLRKLSKRMLRMMKAPRSKVVPRHSDAKKRSSRRKPLHSHKPDSK